MASVSRGSAREKKCWSRRAARSILVDISRARLGEAMKPPSLTIGIEEEYQIIDPHTRELKSYITQILEDSKLILREQVKAELHQSMVEVGTEVCKTPAEARAELVRLRREIMKLAGRNGLKIAAAGTH